MSCSQNQGVPFESGAGQVTTHPAGAGRQGSDPTSARSNTSSTGGYEARSIVKDTTKGKLLTYQIAAVVSAVLAGTESQLLLFFKSTSNFIRPLTPATLRWLLILTYTALIFSISSTISSLVLTENFGDSLGLTKRLGKKVKRTKFRVRKFMRRHTAHSLEMMAHSATPRRWRLMEYHWLFTLIVSVLCLLIQILIYIWTQELVVVKAVIAGVGIFAMFPLLHFLPIRWQSRGIVGKEVSKIRSAEEGTAAMAHPPVTVHPHPEVATPVITVFPVVMTSESPTVTTFTTPPLSEPAES